MRILSALVFCGALASGCYSWSTADQRPAGGTGPAATAPEPEEAPLNRRTTGDLELVDQEVRRVLGEQRAELTGYTEMLGWVGASPEAPLDELNAKVQALREQPFPTVEEALAPPPSHYPEHTARADELGERAAALKDMLEHAGLADPEQLRLLDLQGQVDAVRARLKKLEEAAARAQGEADDYRALVQPLFDELAEAQRAATPAAPAAPGEPPYNPWTPAPGPIPSPASGQGPGARPAGGQF